ncbi:hypothetical protein HZH68_012237 [Vespula germanica]|uniref:Uncharacterized protein n=1 Tax=Vespula germanica TaxID=30212 RepID=A0A834MXM8_VESGE|nr:hypothetical protein HZH68_012237 [Vespula germanica]
MGAGIESYIATNTLFWSACDPPTPNKKKQKVIVGHSVGGGLAGQRRGGKASSGGGPGRRNEEHSTLLYEVLRLRRRKVGWEHSSGFVDPRTGKQGVAGRSVEVVGSSSADDGGNDVGWRWRTRRG